jgi:hypothetical protein
MIDSTPWVNRPHPGRRTVALPLRPAHRAQLEATLRRTTTEQRVARRAQGLLLLADGVAAPDVAQLVGVHERTVEAWRKRFRDADDPIPLLADAHRAGRPPSLFRTPTSRASSPRPAALPPT